MTMYWAPDCMWIVTGLPLALPICSLQLSVSALQTAPPEWPAPLVSFLLGENADWQQKKEGSPCQSTQAWVLVQ